MNNLGIVVPHFGSSQITYEAIKLANSIENAILFFDQLVPPCVPIRCATMCLTETMNFRGALVTTNIANTLMCNKLINRNAVKLIFYVWDLEWLRPGKQNFLYNVEAYKIPDILAVRSNEHFFPLLNYCGREPQIKNFSEVIQC